jgi:hypothetical protein
MKIRCFASNKAILNGSEKDFEPFLPWSGKILEFDTWEILVRIHAAELPSPQANVLRIKFNIQPKTYVHVGEGIPKSPSQST